MGAERVSSVGAKLVELQIDIREPSVIVVFGNVGVGKTTIANEIARRLSTPILNSDEIRKEKFPDPQYQEYHSDSALQYMIKRATALFKRSTASVVLDATFSKRKSRENVAKLARKYGKRIVWVEVVSDQPVPVDGSITGKRVDRKTDEPVEIEQRIVVDNSVRGKNLDELIKILVDQFVIS